MSTLTFKLTLPSRVGTTLSINIIGTNLHVDWGNGETTTQEPNTERIQETRWFDNFVSSTATNSDFKSWTVTITGDITGVGTNCFQLGGGYVTEITLPEGLETIESYGLRYIKAEKVIIPSTVTNIDTYFLYQSGVKEVVFLTKNLTKLNRRFLSDATQVESVKLPEGLISFDTSLVRQGIFYNCVSLKTLEVPSTLEVFPISNTDTANFVNVQLETLKMNGGPIPNPPITENTKIVVPLKKLQDFLNHPSYPDERDRYEVYGKNLSEKIYVLGTHLAENLQNKNIVANANEGLTTLANKIHDINAPNYKELTYNLVWNDNYNEYGFRPSQLPTLLLANNEVVGGCLLPQDDMTSIPQEIYDLADIQVSANNCGTFAELQAIIDEADDGDTITLEKDYKNAGDEEPLEIYNKALHIIGNGHILDANNVTIVMTTSYADESVLEDISFINGNGVADEWNGGGYCGWAETLIDCIFINNKGYIGGACRVAEETNISNCIFINNVSYADEWDSDNYVYGGGGLAVEWPNTDTNIRECIFVNNIAKHGGGIFFDMDHQDEIVDIYDCIFDDISTLYHANNIQNKYSYTTQVPESDLNGEEITYTWEPLKLTREYGVPQVNTSQDVSSTIMTPVQIMLTVQGDTFDSDDLEYNQLIFSSEESAPIIDWGDDTTEVYNKNESLHHTFSDERDKHIITIDGNITALGGSCFSHNTSITNITFLDDNIKLDNNNLFYDCLSLTSIALPNNLTSIGDTCFQFCSSLQSINLPTSIVSLGYGCFDYCLSLTNIVLPNTLTSIPDYCFRRCSSLTSVTLPSGLTDIGRFCFYDCSSLSNISLPNTLTSISDSCFENCSSLTNIILPDSITSLGKRSFSSSGLTSITIPRAVTNIGLSCFMACPNLTDVTFQNPTPPSFGDYVFNNITITIHVPQGAKSAYETALEGQNGAHNWTIVEES